MSPTSLINPAPLAPTVAALRSGQRDLLEYVEQCLARVDALEPQVQAFVPEPNRAQRLRADAEALLERHPEPDRRPPLFGALLGVKDIFNAEGFPTRAGSSLPAEELTGQEADSVTALRAAGALIAGKTVTTEFAYFEPGPTRNPHNLAHTPGGSSSGSAAAVAAGMVTLALGTQTIGSVIRPAAFCGIVGFKPTYNRISPAGLLFFSRSADHVGLFTQDVAGMQLAASVLCEGWRPQSPPHPPVFGVPTDAYLEQASVEAQAAFAAQVETLVSTGYQVKEIPLFPDIAAINQQHRLLIAAEFAQEHKDWFSRHESLYRPRTAALIREGQQASAEEVAEARAGQARLRARVEGAMSEHGVDLWIAPAAPGPAPEGISSTGDPVMNLPWTYLGLPAVTVPAGRASNGLPLGLQMVGRWRQDELLLAWALDVQTLLRK